jgi:hypothetical protein
MRLSDTSVSQPDSGRPAPPRPAMLPLPHRPPARSAPLRGTRTGSSDCPPKSGPPPPWDPLGDRTDAIPSSRSVHPCDESPHPLPPPAHQSAVGGVHNGINLLLRDIASRQFHPANFPGPTHEYDLNVAEPAAKHSRTSHQTPTERPRTGQSQTSLTPDRLSDSPPNQSGTGRFMTGKVLNCLERPPPQRAIAPIDRHNHPKPSICWDHSMVATAPHQFPSQNTSTAPQCRLYSSTRGRLWPHSAE